MSNKPYTAVDARKDAEENKDSRPQRDWILSAIEREAKLGNTTLIVDHSYYHLDLSDWDWLESLGYTIVRPWVGNLCPSGYESAVRYYFGTVSW